jgi:CxxC motif-containing protein (DUF1111 family)
MYLSLRGWGCAIGAFVVACSILPTSGLAQVKKNGPFERGQKLFERVWETGQDAEAGGDGLGPLFNERSCVACHFLGGIGGAGPKRNNVELLTAAIPESPTKLSGLQGRLIKLHMGFAAGSSIVLHRFSTDARYAAFRDGLLGLTPQSARATARKQEEGPVKTIRAHGATLLLTERNATPLFGLGLIDTISQADLEEVATLQTKEDPNVNGRFVGRFGWRGQSNELSDFIKGACAIELGLQVSTHAQVANPLPGAAQISPRENLDLTDQQCDDLTAFVAGLPVPRRIEPADRQQAVYIKNGENLFNSVGCAVCHRPTLGKVNDIYSDLLVHDMGSKLVDPAPAPSDPSETSSQHLFGGYNGQGPALESPTPLVLKHRREWKTPPLWGLRDSGPYLHDGRAETVEEAILNHGGEAASSVARYLALPSPERARLLGFLSRLAAPDPSKSPKQTETTDRSPSATAGATSGKAKLAMKGSRND